MHLETSRGSTTGAYAAPRKKSFVSRRAKIKKNSAKRSPSRRKLFPDSPRNEGEIYLWNPLFPRLMYSLMRIALQNFLLDFMYALLAKSCIEIAKTFVSYCYFIVSQRFSVLSRENIRTFQVNSAVCNNRNENRFAGSIADLFRNCSIIPLPDSD